MYECTANPAAHPIAGKMIWEAFWGKDETPDASRDPTSGWSLVILSVATSIDALAVGLTLGVIGSTILIPVLVIGIVAAVFTVAGMFLGRLIGPRLGKRIEALGGVLLLGIAVKIVLEHTAG